LVDLDTEPKGKWLLENIIEAISDTMLTHHGIMLDDDYAVATSIGLEKFSAHVIIKNYLVDNNIEVAHFTKLLLEEHLKQRLHSIIDPNVNTTLKNFRMLYSHKTGSNRTKKPTRGALRDFIISNKICFDNT